MSRTSLLVLKHFNKKKKSMSHKCFLENTWCDAGHHPHITRINNSYPIETTWRHVSKVIFDYNLVAVIYKIYPLHQCSNILINFFIMKNHQSKFEFLGFFEYYYPPPGAGSIWIPTIVYLLIYPWIGYHIYGCISHR